MKNGKRILTVKFERPTDEFNDDEDHLGTYDMEAKSEFAIPLEHWEDSRGYRYDGGFKFYNGPVGNYTGELPEDIKTYVQQDYEQMKRYNAGEFDYVGVIAKAEIQIGDGQPIQRIRSGGLWGIESDCEDYLQDVEQDELNDLKNQLLGLGFSKRAISTAFKNVQKAK